MKLILVTPGKSLNNNEHLQILYQILQKHDYHAEPWTLTKLIRSSKNTIWHIHWTDEFYRGTLLSKGIIDHHWWLAGFRFINFLLVLLIAKFKNITIIWSIHNVVSHQEKATSLQQAVYKILMRHADTVTAYNKYIKKQMARYGKREIALMRRGSYEGEYLDNIDRATARKKLNIPENAFVFLLFGHILPYKGVDILVKAFKNYHKKNVLLFIAGDTYRDPAYGQQIHRLVEGDKRIRFHDKYIESDEVQCYFRASDYTIYPYRDISHSGVLFLSITFGVPFIVSNKGGVAEILELTPDAGILINNNTETEIKAALDKAQSKSKADISKAIAILKHEYRWEKFEKEIIKVFGI